jgi:ABC-type Na+ efflux pump permease subunit
MRTLDLGPILAVARKEVREYRRTPFVIGTMVVLPIVFMISPIATIFSIGPSAPASSVMEEVDAVFLLLLVIPAALPATLAAYSVVGEREQGTLEPVLTTPIRRGEFLLGKALAAVGPSASIAYILFGLVELIAALFASNPNVPTALHDGPHLLAEALFVPLLAMWSIGVGIGISARSSDVRVAQQLGTLASLPPLAVTVLVTFQVLPSTLGVGLGFGLGLLLLDIAMWRVVVAMFDRERLITGSRATRVHGGGAPGQVRRIGTVPGDVSS